MTILFVFFLYFIIFLSAFCATASVRYGKAYVLFSLCAFFSFSLLFFGLEGYQGDIVHYEKYFDKTKKIEDVFFGPGAWKGDFGFGVIILFSKLFSENYIFFIWLQSIIQILMWSLGAIFISKCFPHALRSRILTFVILAVVSTPYFHFFLGNTLRQGLATASVFLFLSLFSYSLNRWSYLTFLISVFFHKYVLVYLLVAFKKLTLRNLLLAILFTILLIMLYTQTSVLRKIDSYIALGGNAGPSSRRVYLFIHIFCIILIVLTSRYVKRLAPTISSKKALIIIYYMIICISLVSIAFSPIAILLHYRMFASFALFFMIYIALATIIQKNTFKLLYLFAVFFCGSFVILNNSVLNVYVGIQ
jgi:hypothetical protein